MTADLPKSNYHFWKKTTEAKWLRAEMHASFQLVKSSTTRRLYRGMRKKCLRTGLKLVDVEYEDESYVEKVLKID
jgi:hypothetical protein